MRARDYIEGSRILVVDDESDIRDLVADILFAEGADPLTAEDGTKAIEALDTKEFDLVLLDVMMPGLDGFQVASTFRATEAARNVKIPTPILMLTALSGQNNIITAMDAGADDYLVKPFHHGELMARAGGLLRIRRTQERVAGLLAAREKLAGALVHDLRTPLSAILLNAAVMLPKAAASQAPMLEDIKEAGTEMSRLLDDVLLAARSEHLGLVPSLSQVELGALVSAAVEGIRRATPDGDALQIAVEVSGDPTIFPLDEKLLRRVLDNLLGNAVKYGERAAIAVRVRVGSTLQMEVADAGQGIPEGMRDKVFDPFVRADTSKQGYGVGLSFCKTAVQAHGGRIWADASDLGGAALKIEIPLKKARR